MNTDPKQEYALRAGPDRWADYAGELKAASDILWSQEDKCLIVEYASSENLPVKKRHISRTWLLLAAFSIENLLKGILVAENPQFISGGRLGKTVSKHRLRDIARSLGTVDLAQSELDLVTLLEKLLPSWGRYPVPLSADEMQEEILATGAIYSAFDDLFMKLDRHLYELIKCGWNGPHRMRLKALIRSEYEVLPPGHNQMTFEDLFQWRDNQERRRGQ